MISPVNGGDEGVSVGCCGVSFRLPNPVSKLLSRRKSSQIKQLKSYVSMLESELTKAHEEIHDLRRANDILQMDKQGIEEKAESYYRMVNGLNVRVADLLDESNAMKTKIEDLTEETKDKKEKMEEQKEKMEAMSDFINSLKGALEDKQKQLDFVEEIVQESFAMQTKLDELKDALPLMQSLETENQLLQNKLGELEADKQKAENKAKYLLKSLKNRMHASAHGDSAQRICKLCYYEMVAIKKKGQDGDQEIFEYVEELKERKVVDFGVQTEVVDDEMKEVEFEEVALCTAEFMDEVTRGGNS